MRDKTAGDYFIPPCRSGKRLFPALTDDNTSLSSLATSGKAGGLTALTAHAYFMALLDSAAALFFRQRCDSKALFWHRRATLRRYYRIDAGSPTPIRARRAHSAEFYSLRAWLTLRRHFLTRCWSPLNTRRSFFGRRKLAKRGSMGRQSAPLLPTTLRRDRFSAATFTAAVICPGTRYLPKRCFGRVRRLNPKRRCRRF